MALSIKSAKISLEKWEIFFIANSFNGYAGDAIHE